MRLFYAVDDDRAAMTAVGKEVNHPDPARWLAMTADDERLRQTYRALGLLIKRAEVSFVQRKADLRAFRGPRNDYHQAAAEYEAWKSRTLYFVNRACERRNSLTPRVRRLNETHIIRELKAALGTLARAVTDHRDAIRTGGREETPTDRMLWLQLDHLPHVTREDPAPSPQTP
ncbi:hypothetical protein ACFQ68_18895 [Amycolatopsis japonica]|uniref:hypothetical protein n=1 Tax=Amycolatopsis japonica TaxID=208439 RepID=UPI00366DC66B